MAAQCGMEEEVLEGKRLCLVEPQVEVGLFHHLKDQPRALDPKEASPQAVTRTKEAAVVFPCNQVDLPQALMLACRVFESLV